MNAYEKQAVRDAVKEASERSKRWRESRTLPKERWGTPAQLAHVDDTDRLSAERVERDAADIFVNVLVDALRRRGAWIVFLE